MLRTTIPRKSLFLRASDSQFGVPNNGAIRLKIGIFGLVGILGVITAPLVGRMIDKLVLWVGIFVSACALMLSQVLMVGAAGINIGAVIVACFGMPLSLSCAFACG